MKKPTNCQSKLRTDVRMLKQTILSPSTDAVNWTTNASPAYSLNLSFSAKQLPPPPFGPGPGAGGGHHVVTVQRRERPELVFARPSHGPSRPAARNSSSYHIFYNQGPWMASDGRHKMEDWSDTWHGIAYRDP